MQTSSGGLRQDFKTFQVCLAQRLIGTYNSRQRYALPAPIREVALLKCTPPTKRRSTGNSDTDSTAHFPIKGTKGRHSYCWNVKHRGHESTVRCRKCGTALCVETLPYLVLRASSATTRNACDLVVNQRSSLLFLKPLYFCIITLLHALYYPFVLFSTLQTLLSMLQLKYLDAYL